MKRWKLVGIEELSRSWVIHVLLACPLPRAHDLSVSFGEQFLVGGIFPLHQLLDYSKESLALDMLGFFGHKDIRVRGRIVHHLGKEDCACRCKWPPRPPQVQCRWVAVANGLFPCRGNIDRLQRKGNFD